MTLTFDNIAISPGHKYGEKIEDAHKGISWSTSLKQTKRFAERYKNVDDRCSILVKAKINKKYILASFEDKDEVVIDYKRFFDLEFLK